MANLDGIDAALLDLDGVLYVEGELLPGADEAVKRLRGAGIALRFVTNTTANSRSQTLEKLRDFGIELEEDELVTPAALAPTLRWSAGSTRAST